MVTIVRAHIREPWWVEITWGCPECGTMFMLDVDDVVVAVNPVQPSIAVHPVAVMQARCPYCDTLIWAQEPSNRVRLPEIAQTMPEEDEG